jgi:hypothetical protein
MHQVNDPFESARLVSAPAAGLGLAQKIYKFIRRQRQTRMRSFNVHALAF